MATIEAEIKSTNKYDLFKFNKLNRVINEAHVLNLARSIEEHGNLTYVMPVVVDENMEVIDGQHRVKACEIADVPVYYVVGGDMTIDDVRVINTKQRNWTIDDYIASYAAQGDESYKTYQELREEFNAQHNVLMYAIEGGVRRQTPLKRLRNGELQFNDSQDIIRVRDLLDLTYKLASMVGGHGNRSFLFALMKAIMNERVDNKRLEDKFKKYGSSLYKRYLQLDDNIRLVEDIYNYMQSEETRIRL